MACAAPDTRSKLTEKLSQAGLDGGFWADVLKTKLNVTLPQQIQYLDESHLKVLKDATRQEWEEKALRTLLDIKGKPKSHLVEEGGKSEIAVKLAEAALDVEYWVDVLKTKLGITRMEQTKNMNIEDINKLKDAVRHNWEENALKTLFGIDEEAYEASLCKRLKQNRQKVEEARKLMEVIVQSRNEGAHHTDDTIRSKFDQLRQLMNVEREPWVGRYNDENLDDIISKVNSDLQCLDKLTEDRPVYSASDVLANASGGLALRGFLVGEALSDDCVTRTVLSTPTDVKLMNPIMTQVDDVVHFSTKLQSDHFHRSLDIMGFSVAVNRNSWPAFEAKFEGSKKHEKEDENESHEQTHIESRVKYSVVPTAACELHPYSLKLSQHALKELQTIDRLLIEPIHQELVEKKM